MSCNSCGKNGLPGGCRNNGLCGISGCNKLNAVNWLANVIPPSLGKEFNGVEIRFKNGRKEYFVNTNQLSLYIGDLVVVQCVDGFDVGVVSLTGDLVKVQMNKRKLHVSSESLPAIERKASIRDVEKWESLKAKESQAMLKSRLVARSLNLSMKISDVEFQGDGKKVIFYYTAENRVDFRDLVKKLAEEYKMRIEMKQIGMRQEASRIGGIGSCGRELCCSTWLTDFRSVSTSAARYQQLSINPEKLAGQCGKLKCCLNYELDNYLEELKKFPGTDKKLLTKKGSAFFIKMDIFKNTMTYAYSENPGHGIEITLSRVQEIMSVNKDGKKVNELLSEENQVKNKSLPWTNDVGREDLNRFAATFQENRGRKKKKNKRKGQRRRQKSVE